jgi:ASC-1-like (ASCH) protein
MDHVAIMKKGWKMIPKILSGEKKIESRWGINKCTPWGKVKKGDIVYFKNSGDPVIAKARVGKVQEFENFNPQKVMVILKTYGGKDGIAINDLNTIITWAKNKRFCILIYLESPQPVKPFYINKTGFGAPAAWITVKNINEVRECALHP